MKYLSIILVLCAAVACDSTSKKTICPDGSECAAIDCSSESNHAGCVTMFGQLCPNGYDIVETNNNGYYLIRCYASNKWNESK